MFDEAWFYFLLIVAGCAGWVLRGMRLNNSMRGDGKYRCCPRCTAPLRYEQTVCEVCDWPHAIANQPRPTQVHGAIHRVLYRFHQLGLLPDAKYKALLRFAADTLQPAQPEKQPATPEAARAPTPVEAPVVAIQATHPQPKAEPAPPAPTPGPAAPPKPAVPLPEVVSARAEKYAAHRAVAAEAATHAPPPPPKKAQPWSRVFQAFLQKNNILWGELVGGLMIVCCSIALVISFWAEIAERPLLKFSIFNGVSAAMFAVGFYTDRRWKIHTTSHGVLTIATLLAPLNFLAIAAFTDASPPTDLLSLAGEGLSLAMFSALVYYAARTITPLAPVATAVGVMAPCLLQLLTRRFVSEDATALLLNGFALAPIGVFAGASIASLRGAVSEPKSGEQQATRHLLSLGLCLFAMLLPLALLLHKAGDIADALRQIAPLLAVVGAPLIATAVLFARRLEETSVPVRVAGASVGVLGAMMLAASLGLSWPLPWAVAAASVVNAVTGSVLARVCGLPRLNWLAAAGLAVGWLVTAAVLTGGIAWNAADASILVRTLVSATSGARLVPLVALLVGAAFISRRFGRSEDSLAWGQSAAATAAASLAMLLWFGFGRLGDPSGAALCFAIYALIAVVASLVIEHRGLAYSAASLVLIALIQTLVYRYGDGTRDFSHWIVALLVHSTLSVILAWTGWRSKSVCREAFATAGFATSILATGLALTAGFVLDYTFLAIAWMWISALWLALALFWRAEPLYPAFQVALGMSLSLAVTGIVSRESWFTAAIVPWSDPWYLQTLGVALSLYALVWRGLRLGGLWLAEHRQNLNLAPLAKPHWASVDRALEVGLLTATVLLCLYATFPGAAVELSPSAEPQLRVPVEVSSFELVGVPASHASGPGGWALLAAVAVLTAVGLWERHASLRVIALLVLDGAGCALASAGFTDQVANASALRWLLSCYAVVVSVPILLRDHLKPRLLTLGVRLDKVPAALGDALSSAARGLVVGMVVLFYVAVAGFVSVSCVHTGGIPSGVVQPLAWLAGLSVLGAAAWFVLGVMINVRTTAGETASGLQMGRGVLALATLVPLLVVLAFVVATNLTAHPLVGPDPASWFAQIGNAACYGGPLAIFALVLLGFAVREQSSAYAFSFGLLSSGVATLVFMLQLASAGRALDAVAWMEVLQLNAGVLAVTALAWRAALVWSGGKTWLYSTKPVLLVVQSLLALVFAVQTVIAGCWGVFQDPDSLDWEQSIARPAGLAALALAGVAAWLSTRGERRLGKHDAGVLALSAVGVLTICAAVWDTGDWRAFHTMLAAAATAAALLVALPARLRSAPWVTALAACTTVLAFRDLDPAPKAPSWPWWTVTALSASYAVMLVLAARNAVRWPVWLATPLALCAGSIAWFEAATTRGRAFTDFLNLNIVVLGVAAILSVFAERLWTKKRPEALARMRLIGFHRFAVWLSIVVIAVSLLIDLFGYSARQFSLYPWLPYLAWGITLAGAIACLWDRHVRWPIAAFYLIGLAGIGRYIDSLHLPRDMFVWSFTLALSAFVLAVSYLWGRREGFTKALRRFGAPIQDSIFSAGRVWLVSANSVAVVLVTLLVFAIQITDDEFARRMTAAYSLLACGLGLGFMATGRVENTLRYAALCVGALFAVAFGWAWAPPSIAAPLLHRLVASAVALAAMTPVYGVGLVKLKRVPNEWTRAAQKLVPVLSMIAGALLVMILLVETTYLVQEGAAPLASPAVLAVAVTLAGLAVIALLAAVAPGRDPFGLSERGRTVYVYAAEVLLGLLFMHLRVTMPWLFGGWFTQFWPFIVMAIAFAGAGLSEWFRRRQHAVFVEPLANTGALLPLLPLLGFWSSSTAGSYALLLVATGLLYTSLSVLRKSPVFAALAAVAFNGSLWTMLHTVDGLGLLQHPQFWLIPPALCVLLGAQLNHRRMTPEQLASARYGATLVVYASSTADICINGVGTGLWLPMVLAALAVAGVMLGILLRVRAFLFLGVAFLCVALFSIIWHAAVELERTWVWWISGIVAGAAIIFLFGLFEKKRDEVLAVAQRLRSWEA